MPIAILANHSRQYETGHTPISNPRPGLADRRPRRLAGWLLGVVGVSDGSERKTALPEGIIALKLPYVITILLLILLYLIDSIGVPDGI